MAMAAGISRNFNIYTPDELAAFAEKLIGAPVYLEHVDVSAAAGKVTKGTYDPASRCVLYEAEIYDSAVAEKIRNGLIQHVSVGADYSAIDVVSANVYHGLYNPELSLVAVPGIPETTINVLEGLAHMHTSVPVRELHLSVREAADDLPTLFSAFKVRFVASPDACEKCLALDGKEFIYGQEPGLPHDGCKCPGYKLVERLVVHVNRLGVENLSLAEKDLENFAKRLAAKLNVKEAVRFKCPKCGAEFDAAEWEANGWKCPNKDCGVEVVPPGPVALALRGEASVAEKLSVAESARDAAKTELANVNKLLEKYRKVAPGVELLASPPVLMPVSECLDRLGRLELPKMLERLSLGNQVQAQKVRREIYEVKQKYGGQ